MKLALLIGLIISRFAGDNLLVLDQNLLEGRWINIEYQQAILEKKDFSERSKLSFNFLSLKKDQLIIEYRFEQQSQPTKIVFLDKEKSQFKALGFNFNYAADTIFMKHENKIEAKFVRYVR